MCGQVTVASPKAESPDSEQKISETWREYWALPDLSAMPALDISQCHSLPHTSFFPGQRRGRGRLLASLPQRATPKSQGWTLVSPEARSQRLRLAVSP